MPINDYHKNTGAFGAMRGNDRKHAGCDLYCKEDTPVYSVDDGVVVDTSETFYKDTGAVTIQHDNFMARYAEIWPAVEQGDHVRAGELIGAVKRPQGEEVCMLHFEMYEGFPNISKEPLTNTKNPPFMRSKSLIDPTTYLDAAGYENE
jgi:murein DD-endopeptidase MepM/ murein hydrolase activator NlpD